MQGPTGGEEPQSVMPLVHGLRMARGLSVALLLVAVAPVYTSQSSSPSVHHLDPSCSSGQQSCRGAVEDALLACKVAARPCVIALAAGTYLWNTTRGTVAAANLTGGLTILAEGGAVEIVTYGAVLGGLLHLQFVAPVLIRGPISVDTVRLCPLSASPANLALTPAGASGRSLAHSPQLHTRYLYP